jgi:acyl carrier protein phosphodiesterase
MNYLAHLYLAADTPESLLGNLLGDFRKGLDLETLPSAIVDGIQQHQRVDIFTDTHPIVRQAKLLVAFDRRRFAGILVDVFYDHYLSVHWSTYSQVPLRVFIDQFYEVLISHQESLPDYLGRAVPYIVDQDWLGCYGTIDGIALTLTRMSHRMRRSNPIADGIQDLVDHYEAFDRSFVAFFPALIDYAKYDR